MCHFKVYQREDHYHLPDSSLKNHFKVFARKEQYIVNLDEHAQRDHRRKQFVLMQSFESLIAKSRHKKWIPSESTVWRSSRDAWSWMQWPQFPAKVNLTILPSIANCTASRQELYSRKPKFVVVLKTRVEEIEQRRVIRETWARELNAPVVFAVGKSARTLDNWNTVNESKTYGDILQADFIDTYFNLAFKSLSILQWMDKHCPQVDFYVQGDSDMLFSPRMLQSFVAMHRYSEKEIHGVVYTHALVLHSDKYAVNPASYPYAYFPDYCSGRVLLMTKDVPHRLLYFHERRVSKRDHSGYISVDDAYFTGIIAQEAGVQRINASKIVFLDQPSDYGDTVNPCNTLAVGEFKSPRLMRAAWSTLSEEYEGC
uniref:Hexosyltransferase n=1 Tax=Trichuris muris TaxID=70415 RepID=A0A5S6R330_TRIMR